MGRYFINWTQARVIGEEKTSIEKLACRQVWRGVSLINDCCKGAQITMGGHVALGCMEKQTEQAMRTGQ